MYNTLINIILRIVAVEQCFRVRCTKGVMEFEQCSFFLFIFWFLTSEQCSCKRSTYSSLTFEQRSCKRSTSSSLTFELCSCNRSMPFALTSEPRSCKRSTYSLLNSKTRGPNGELSFDCSFINLCLSHLATKSNLNLRERNSIRSRYNGNYFGSYSIHILVSNADAKRTETAVGKGERALVQTYTIRKELGSKSFIYIRNRGGMGV